MSTRNISDKITKRLNQTVTVGEVFRLIFGILLAAVLFVVGSVSVERLFWDTDGLLWDVLFLAAGIALPAFLAVFVGVLPLSWRYKLIGGALMLFVLIGIFLSDIFIYAAHGFMGFVGGVIRFSCGSAAAALGLYFWVRLRERRASRAEVIMGTLSTDAVRPPQTPLLLLILSLLSIPAVYATIILSAFVTIGLATILFFILTDSELVPLYLLAAALLAPLIAIVSTVGALYSILISRPIDQIGCAIDLQTHPALRSLLQEVCARVGTRMPDNVIVIAEPGFYVTQGKVKLSGQVKTGRTLAMGIPLLKSLEADELCCILSHEFAHFSGRDTLYSSLVSPVYRGLQTSLGMLTAGGPTTSKVVFIARIMQLPSVMFLEVLTAYFHSLNMILSRRRELRADWVAAQNFGREAQVAALTKATGMALHFEESIGRLRWPDEDSVFVAYAEACRQDGASIDSLTQAALSESETEFSSHPTLTSRIRSLPLFKGVPYSGCPGVAAELAGDEKKLSRQFAPVVEYLQEQLAVEQGEVASSEETGDTAEHADESASSSIATTSDEAPASPETVFCKGCNKAVVPTFHGCCPECEEYLT